MTAVQQHSQPQYPDILNQFALHNKEPKRQSNTFNLFMSILGHFATIQKVTADHIMFGTFYIQVEAIANGKQRALNFFLPCTGGAVYRYTEDKEKLTIYLHPSYEAEDKAAALNTIRSSGWLALPGS